MKKTAVALVTALCLASCAPQLQQESVATSSRSYQGDCVTAIDLLNQTAIRTRPIVLSGANRWPLLQLVNRSLTTAQYTSTTDTVFKSAGMEPVRVTATCTNNDGRALVTVASSGQLQQVLDTLNAALLNGITLPR